MIRVTNLTKTFGGFKALDDLSMSVPKGSVYGLVGPNGAGKSTILRHITGVYRPDSGTIEVDGQPVYENADLKSRIAYIPDDLYYFTSASLLDMKKFYQGFYPNFDAKLFQKLADIFPIDPKKSIRHLSRGMQKQATIRLALSARPELLVLDEPAAGLDPQGRHTIFQGIRDYNRNTGCTVLIVSHSMEDMAQYCDDVVVMAHSKVLMAGDRDHVFARADELEAVGLDIPQVTKLCLLLREGGMPMPAGLYTVDSAEDALVKLFSEARGKGGKRV